MSKFLYTIAAAIVLVPTMALASPGDDGCIGNCPQTNGGGGTTEVDNANTNTNSNKAVAGAIAGATSDSTATGIGVGGSSTVGVAVKTGPAISGSISNAKGGQGGTGGSSVAHGGNSAAFGGSSRSSSVSGDSASSVGDVTSRSGDSTASASNVQNLGVTTINEEAASRAATVYSQVCENGGSAQGVLGGFSVTNQDVVCEQLKIAAVMRESYMWELKHGSLECVESMAGPKMANGTQYTDVCFNEKALKYYEAYHEAMDDAMRAIDKYEEAGLMDKVAGALVRPMALIGALIWLI